MRMPWVLLVLAACSSSGESTEHKAGDPVKPMRIELGDCAPQVSFVSGPRPRPFTVGADGAPAATSEQESGSGFASLTMPGTWSTAPSGGLGLRGFGPGAMTGGSGPGRGGMPPRGAAVPTISLGTPIVMGDLDKAIIRRYLKRNQAKLQYCYEKELRATPGLAGTVMANFVIAPTGSVTDATASGVSPKVASCIARVIRDIEFPKPKGGGRVQVRYPLVFDPGAGAPAAPAAPPGSGSAAPPAGTGSAAPPAGAGSAASAPPGPRSPPPYTPGAGNPFRGQEAALAACVRRQPQPYGVFVVDLAYEASGTKATVHGLPGDAAGPCVAEVARMLAKQQAPAQRCAVAFGEMPIAEAPAVEITADELRWLGKRVDSTSAVLAADPRLFKIDALYEAGEVYAKQTAAAGPVALRGPVLLRAPDATPMKIVGRIVFSMAAADIELVLARRGPTDWKLLHRIDRLPVVPVPAGTGARWNRRGSGVLGGDAEDRTGPLPPELSILVTKEQIWIGLSGVNEFVEVPRSASGHDFAKLEQALAEHKRGKLFADRDELEVAAEDAVPYGDVASVLEVADKVGFTYARVLDPASLSARPGL